MNITSQLQSIFFFEIIEHLIVITKSLKRYLIGWSRFSCLDANMGEMLQLLNQIDCQPFAIQPSRRERRKILRALWSSTSACSWICCPTLNFSERVPFVSKQCSENLEKMWKSILNVLFGQLGSQNRAMVEH